MSSAGSDIEDRARSDVAPNGAGRDFLCGAIKILLLAELVPPNGICSPKENLLAPEEHNQSSIFIQAYYSFD